MNKSAQKRIIKIKNSPEKIISILASVFSGLLVITGILTLIIIQKPLTEQQDLRRSASTSTGQVAVESNTSSSGTFPLNTPASIELAVNTHGVQTDGVQLVFDVVTDTFGSLDVEILNSAGLQSGYKNIQTTSNGFKVAIIAIPTNIGSSFSTNTATSFAKLTFTPTQAGSITLNFDQGQSISTVHSSNPPTDELKTVSSLSFTAGTVSATDCTYTYSDWGTCSNNQQSRTVTSKSPSDCTSPSPVLTQSCESNPAACVYTYSAWGTCTNGQQSRTVATKTPSNCTQPNPVLTQTCTVAPGECVYSYSSWGVCSNNQQSRTVTSKSPSDCTSPDPVLTQSCSTDTSLKSCNESCSSNSDCQANYLCYSSTKTCRLATNPTNSSCQGVADNGLNRTCNEYCADTNECASGYFCFYNRCRIPENPDSTACSQPNTSTTASISSKCNTSCQTNSQCGSNMRCYNSQCRLASNPSSSSCTSAPVTTYHSNNYQVGSTANNTKGADLSTGLGLTKTSTMAAIVLSSPVPSPSPISSVKPMPNTESVDTQTLEDQTAFEALSDNLKQRGLALPIAMIGSGILLMLLVVTLWYLKKSPRRKPTSGMYRPSVDDQKHLTNLEHQIQSLQAKPPAYSPPFPAQQPLTPIPSAPPVGVSPTSTTITPPITQPVSASSKPIEPTPSTNPISSSFRSQPPVIPESPMKPQAIDPVAFPSSQPTSSSMVERLKQKGVEPPASQSHTLFEEKQNQ